MDDRIKKLEQQMKSLFPQLREIKDKIKELETTDEVLTRSMELVETDITTISSGMDYFDGVSSIEKQPYQNHFPYGRMNQGKKQQYLPAPIIDYIMVINFSKLGEIKGKIKSIELTERI